MGPSWLKAGLIPKLEALLLRDKIYVGLRSNLIGEDDAGCGLGCGYIAWLALKGAVKRQRPKICIYCLHGLP